MKWLVCYSQIYFTGKGDPYSKEKIIGYSDLNEKDLFKVLQKEYPNLPIRKEVKVDEHHTENYDNNGVKDKYSLYESYVYFKSNDLKEF